jgi:cysteine desulfuration protein SufE
MAEASINSIQDEVIEEFALFEVDRNGKLEYLIDIGNKLPELPSQHQQDENLVKGCLSKVWLVSELEENKVKYLADSNTAITKGLVALLIRILSGQSPDSVAKADLYFIEKIGMGGFIGSQRSNGFLNMIKKMKLEAAQAYMQLEGGK